ncbi:MAG: 5-phospho-D-xylono,4-lactonase [Chloroflexota bacterium]|nr:5-phospho-D-xylono,4-lactonase [Chloroflexota bacterium]
MAKFRTVLGDVDVKEMGFTLPHEHLITRPPNTIIKGDPDLLLDDVSKPMQELSLFKQAGGGTLADLAPKSYGRNVPVIVDASQKTGVHVIATTGYLKGAYFPKEVSEWSVNQIADFMISEVVDGMDGGPHKAGIVKAGSSYNVISDLEVKVFKAAVIAANQTGAPLMTHTEKGSMGLEQVELVKSLGFDTARFIVSHVDINPDYYLHKKMCSLGAYLIHDGPSKVKYGTDEHIVDILRKLVADGFADRQLLSCDMGRRSYWTSYGGGPGFTYIPQKFVPRLLDEGFSQELVDQFTTGNAMNALQMRPV